MKIEIFQDTTIKLGTNKKENWTMLKTNKNFIWMHLDSFPSGYIIIENENPNNEILEFAANLCKNNTKYKNMKNLKISFTKVSNLIKGENIGEVYFKSNKKVDKIKL